MYLFRCLALSVPGAAAGAAGDEPSAWTSGFLGYDG